MFTASFSRSFVSEARSAVDFVGWVEKHWVHLSGGGAAVWAAAKWWSVSARAGRKDRADLVRIAQDAASQVIQDLRDENTRKGQQIADLERRQDALQNEMTDLRKGHIAMVEAKDARIVLLEAQVRQALATAAAYEKLLEEHGIPHEKPAQPFWLIADGHVAHAAASPAGSE